MADDPKEMAARVRAARGYSGLKAKELAKALSVSVETMSRIENGRRPLQGTERDILLDLSKVPEWFLDSGWSGHGSVTSDERANQLQRDFETLSREVSALALAVAQSMQQGGGKGSAAEGDQDGQQEGGEG